MSWSIWKIKRNRDSKRMIIFILFINLLIITLIFVSEFINSMILTTFSIMIFVLKDSQTYYCSFLFCVIDRDLMKLTWNLITSSSKRILKKIFWASETKTMISIREKMTWALFNLIKNFFSFISFLQISMMRNLFETLLRANNEAIFWSAFIFLIILMILSFSLSRTNRERSLFFSSYFSLSRTFFWKTSFITRSRTSSSFFIVIFFHFFDRNIFEMNNFSFFFFFFFRMRFINSWCLTSFLNTLNFDRIVAKMTSTLT
jgi:hypothetical protein